jgi:phospholipid/cholesterol/gamma-HCH transport system substrate-binding protein
VRNPLRGVLRKSFLERNQVVIGILGILFLFGGSAFALLLSGGFFEDTYSVTAKFEDAAGIRSGDDVTVAGLEAGSVGDIRIVDGIVEVELKVKQDVKMPADSEAEIVIETLLGKKSVDLVAGGSSEDLKDGSEISLERTTTPIDVQDLNDASVTLMERSDAQALEQLMTEVTKVTEGKAGELRVVIDGLAEVSETLGDKKRELQRLIDSLSTLATTFGERDDTIVQLIDRYDVVLANLADQREELEILLESTDSASHEVADLVGRNKGELNSTLAHLHQAFEVVSDHQLDLAASISYLEESVRGYSSVGYSQGTPNRWANIFVQSLGPLGPDAIAGRCGLVDEALDEFLGPDPRKERQGEAKYCAGGSDIPHSSDSEGDGANGNRSGGTNGNGRNADDRNQDAPEGDDDGLPGDIGDLFDGVPDGVLEFDL